jgi:hypothetical protein
MKKTFGIFRLLPLCLFLAGCSTGWGPIDTTLTVNLSLQPTNADTLRVTDWLPFYYYGDTTQYRLDSYENALAGRLTPLGGGASVSGIPAEVIGDTGVQFPHLSEKSVILWIVQPGAKMYAWRQLDLVDGGLPLSMALSFRAWEKAGYVDHPSDVPCRKLLAPVTLQPGEPPAAGLIYTKDWKAFSAPGDTTKYRLASYDDALKGKLTPRADGSAVDGQAAVLLDTTRIQFPHLTQAPTIQWIVSTGSDRIYAWRQLDLTDDDLPSTRARLLFRVTATEDYVENKWNVVVPQKAEPEE